MSDISNVVFLTNVLEVAISAQRISEARVNGPMSDAPLPCGG